MTIDLNPSCHDLANLAYLGGLSSWHGGDHGPRPTSHPACVFSAPAAISKTPVFSSAPGKKANDRTAVAISPLREKFDDTVKGFGPGATLKERVTQPLQWDKMLAETPIDVLIIDHDVELKGRLKSAEQKRRLVSSSWPNRPLASSGSSIISTSSDRLAGDRRHLAAQPGHVTLAVRMNAIAEKDHGTLATWVDPDRRAGEAGVAEADSFRKNLPAIGRERRSQP